MSRLRSVQLGHPGVERRWGSCESLEVPGRGHREAEKPEYGAKLCRMW